MSERTKARVFRSLEALRRELAAAAPAPPEPADPIERMAQQMVRKALADAEATLGDRRGPGQRGRQP